MKTNNTNPSKETIVKAHAYDSKLDKEVCFNSKKYHCESCLNGDSGDIDGCCCIHTNEYYENRNLLKETK